MRDYSLLKINLIGGIVSPGTLEVILQAAKQADVRQVRFGARQQLHLWVKAETMRGSGLLQLKEQLSSLGIDYEIDSEIHPNIISSYCAQEVFPTGQWLSEGIYKDILDGFDFSPQLKINISDNQQSFTPFFTGNLNFIASSTPNFWYLYIRYKQSNQLFRLPILIYTLEIPKVAKRLEQLLLSERPLQGDLLYEQLMAQGQIIAQNATEEVQLPQFMLPYYEGFNRYGNKTWLGIYRRHETFDIDFLIEMCHIALATKIGQICVTPWKSLIIKNISNQDRLVWDKLLGKFGINVRHAANELNWQVEDLCEEGLALKHRIVREFDGEDVRTFGLCFAIQTRSKSEVYGSVVIKKRKIFGGLSSVYDIYHTSDFNPNTRTLTLFEKGLNKAHIAEILQRLSKRYYQQHTLLASQPVPVKPQEAKPTSYGVHQCQTCFTIYDDRFGDSFNGIAAGIRFAALPEDYCCPICESAKSTFKAVEVSLA